MGTLQLSACETCKPVLLKLFFSLHTTVTEKTYIRVSLGIENISDSVYTEDPGLPGRFAG
jgi:hypothetical protein